MARGTTDLAQFFSNGEVLTSSELIQRLTTKGYTDENARQVIRRHAAGDGLWRSTALKLSRNERLFARAATVNRHDFLETVAHKLEHANRHGIARCLAVLGHRRVLNKVDVMRLLAVAPANMLPSRGATTRAYETDLAGIREIGVEVRRAGTALESLVITADGAEDLDWQIEAAAQSLRKELVLARVLIDRLRQQNILAWNQVEVPEPTTPFTVFNDQIFTASGFSYLSPIVRWKQGTGKPTPCPVVIDCYHQRCTVEQVDSFVQRIERAGNRGKVRQQVLGIIGAPEFDRDAWNRARSQGLAVVSFRQAFGDEALEVMTKVEGLIHEIGTDPGGTSSQDRVIKLSQMLDDVKTNPIVAVLRAIGFEVLCGLILRSRGYEQVELGRIVPWGQTTREVDVFGLRGSILRIIECKACHGEKSVSPEEVRKFFTQTVPATKKWLRSQGREFTKCTAEIWTTGRKGKRAGDALYELNSPRTDRWRIRRIEEIRKVVPQAIRRRSLELLNSIATAEIDGSPPDEDDRDLA